MNSFKIAGFEISYNQASAYQMLYAEHRSFITTGTSKAAVAFRNQEAKLLSEGKFLEAFDLNSRRVVQEYGSKYNEAISQARDYFENQIVPELQRQYSQKNGQQR